jgi:hypothetical protein
MTVAEAITKANKASEFSNARKAISEAFKRPGFESVIDRDLEYLQPVRMRATRAMPPGHVRDWRHQIT